MSQREESPAYGRVANRLCKESIVWGGPPPGGTKIRFRSVVAPCRGDLNCVQVDYLGFPPTVWGAIRTERVADLTLLALGVLDLESIGIL